MFQKQTLPFEETELLNTLLQDYLLRKKDTEALYSHYPNLEGYKKLLQDDKLFSSLNRELLVQSLTQQANSVSNTSKESLENIALLANTNCFTVTTGHQLCLFTGPLYFIYKIISTINLSEWLNTNFPNMKFVPVYWMASEDHDFEEVNHIFAYGKKLSWASEEKGAVGNFDTRTLQSTIEELENLLGPGQNAKELMAIFKNAYAQKTLSDATRYLVNELFGKYGLVTADGNDKQLKKEFTPMFKKDIFDNTIAKKINDTISYLKEKNHPIQVNPRDINCFYLSEEGRNRIEKDGDSFKIVGTNTKFTKEELTKIVDNEPWKISPNVVLRPMYQQTILPNIAYVGGPGELSYWLEYKASFESMNIPFPILQPRVMLSIIEKNQVQKLEKLGLELKDIFKTEQDLINMIVSKKGETIELTEEKKKIEHVFEELVKKSAAIDKTLEGSVRSELQKAINSLNTLEGKLNRSLKQRSETEINQIKAIKGKLFPENIPQERYDNISMYYSKFGREFIEAIKTNTAENVLSYVILSEA